MFSMFELIIQDPNLLQHWTSLNADGVQDDMDVFDEKLKQLILHDLTTRLVSIARFANGLSI